MPHKEHYRLNLPHYQQPGQAYFVTWCLKDAVPAHALKHYTKQLEIIKSQIDSFSGSGGFPTARGKSVSEPIQKATADRNRQHPLKQKYYTLRKQYIKAYNDLLDAQKNPEINLAKPEYTKIIRETLLFWEGKKLNNHAFCIMPNHVHWVLQVFEKDENNISVYLEDLLKSVKQFTSTEINKIEKRKGKLWQKESFDTTIRDHKHLYYAMEYTLNNPVNAGFVKDWRDWEGCYLVNL